MANRSVMTHQFSQVPAAEIQRSSFDRSHGYKTTFDAGFLVPVFIDEVLPGDTFNLKMTAFARLATPIKPIMDNIFLDSFFFFVPNRLVWDNWQKFCGEQVDPGDSTDYLIPSFTRTTDMVAGSRADYFGIPTNISPVTFNMLHHRAYNLIWNEWFRDQNLQDSVTVEKGDTTASYTPYGSLLRRNKRHDYFTSALPFPQKGDAVTIPLGTYADVISDNDIATTEPYYGTGQPTVSFQGAGAGVLSTSPITVNDRTVTRSAGATSTTFAPMDWENPHLVADLTDATAATINSLREAFQIQRMFERDARGGTRYTEIVRAHFGVTSPDARLQRPEYLGGSSSPVNISPVAQTQQTTSDPDTTPQGNLAAIGTGHMHGHGFSKSFTEHGVVIGLVNARADLTYQQGLNRMFSRQTRFDFYWPALSHLGEQAVLNGEIYWQGTADDQEVFGYQERYAEYRYKPSLITGRFRSTDPVSLDVWHLSQEFTSLPALNEDFIIDNPPIDRVIAVTDEPHFLFDAYFDFKCARPMPVYGVPGLIDHF